MNNFSGLGRVCTEIEVRYSQGDNPVAFGSYSIAIDRPKAKDKDVVTDFIPCKVVGKTAEFAEKYLKKGMKIAIEGRLQIDKYEDKNGNKKSFTYVQVANHYFCESKQGGVADGMSKINAPIETDDSGFMNIPDGIDEELPFN